MTVQEEAEKYFDIGMECDKNKDFAGAINNFSKVIEIDPNNEYAYFNEVRMVQFRDYESKDIILDENFEVPKLYIEYNKEITTKSCEEIIVGPKGSFEEISAYGKYVGMKQCTKSKIQYR